MTACIVDNKHDCNQVIADHYKFLPQDTKIVYINDPTIQSKDHYSQLLLTKEFWQQFETEHVLIFQHDSGLLKRGIEDFYQFDYIGASWHFEPYVGNGGLSLRKKSAMIYCLENYSKYKYLPEDMFYGHACTELKLNLASVAEADTFSVETKFILGSFGYHQIETYHSKEQCEQIKNQYK